MASQIEKMNRMRRNILLGVLIGSVIAFALLMYPTIYSIIHLNARLRWSKTLRFFEGALILWILTLLIFIIRYLLYKKKLRKDPSLLAAVNDERIKLNWLKAYRFAFFTIIGITIFWKLWDMFLTPDLLALRISFPHGPWLILFGSVISLVGAFLYYNREAQDG